MDKKENGGFGIFKVAENQQAYLKAGILGFAGSGKTYTASLIAKGIAEKSKKKAVAFLDTEVGSDFLVPRFKEWGIRLYVSKSRAFVDLLDGVKAAEDNVSVLIIDSVSHFWTEVQESYKKAHNRTRLAFQDWGPLKSQWARFTDLYLNSRLHIIMCGRAGYEYGFFEDEDGKKQLEKTGTKMKVEGEMGYEPSLMVEMVREKIENPDGRVEAQLWNHTAYILKDRTQAIEGKRFVNPTFQGFEPVFNFLNLGGEHIGVQTAKDSSALFAKDSEQNFYEQKRQKEILVEELQGEFVSAYPGQSAEDKKTKADLCFQILGTRSWTAVGEMPIGQLKEGLDKLRQVVKLNKQIPVKPANNTGPGSVGAKK